MDPEVDHIQSVGDLLPINHCTVVSNDEEDDDLHPGAENDRDYSSDGNEEESSPKDDSSVTTTLTSATEPVSDMGSFRLPGPIKHDDVVSNDEEDEDLYPGSDNDNDYSSVGNEESSPKEDSSVTTTLTSATEPVSDMGSFRLPGPPLTDDDDDDIEERSIHDDHEIHSPPTKKRKKKKGARNSDDACKKSKKKASKSKGAGDDTVSKKSTKSKKKKNDTSTSNIDYSGLSLTALKLVFQVCSIPTDGLNEKADYVKALEDFKKAEAEGKNKESNNDETTNGKTKYAENDTVLYVSSNGDSERATILKVHLDDDLVPFYDIRLDSSQREKQTDDAHLSLLPLEKKKKKKIGATTEKSPRRSRTPSIKMSTTNKSSRRSSTASPIKMRTRTVKPPRRASTNTSLRTTRSVSKKRFAANEKVLYVSSIGQRESATILKVHMDDDLVPFYDIRLDSSGREKQTDNAHLAPLSGTRNKSTKKKTQGKPKRRNSTTTLRSCEHSFTSDQSQRRSTPTFGSLPDGFVSPLGNISKRSSSKKSKSPSENNKLNNLTLSDGGQTSTPSARRTRMGNKFKGLSTQLNISPPLATPESSHTRTGVSSSHSKIGGASSSLSRTDVSSTHSNRTDAESSTHISRPGVSSWCCCFFRSHQIQSEDDET